MRFDAVRSEHVNDGWDRVEELPVLRTTVSIEVPRRVISKTRRLIGRLIHTVAANMAAFIALPVPVTRIWACPQGWILKSN